MKKNKLFITFLIVTIFLGAVSMCAYSREDAPEYRSQGKRDPFVPLAGTTGFGPGGGAQNIRTIDDAKLEGILIGPNGKYNAIISGEIMAVGDQAGLLKVLEIGKNSVKVTIEDTEYELKLYE